MLRYGVVGNIPYPFIIKNTGAFCAKTFSGKHRIGTTDVIIISFIK